MVRVVCPCGPALHPRLINSSFASFNVTDTGTLRAALGDGLTSGPVPGRAVDFYVDGVKVGTGVTDNAGNTSTPYTPPLGSVGAHCVQARFAGDALYNSSNSAGGGSCGGTNVTVNKDGTVLTYTGTLTSSPSKPVTLTAKLTDDLARALAGKTVNFQLGSQTCNGQVTSATGIVSCTIPKLTQKPGQYPLIVSFAGDADYVAASVNAVFSLPK